MGERAANSKRGANSKRAAKSKRASDLQRAADFERRSGRGLPADYRTFIDTYDGGPRVAHEGLEFRLSTADELLAPYTLDGTEMIRPFFSAHILHLAGQRDSGVLIYDGAAGPVSPERFESMDTVGVGASAETWQRGEPPTHLLVLDPADGSLRAVPTDPPALVRKVADSFGKWIKAARRKPRKTAATSKSKTTRAKAPKKVKAPTVASVLTAFKKKNKLTLPPAYAKFLKTHEASKTYAGPGGEPWQLATLAELADPHLGTARTADGKTVPAVRLTRAFADAFVAERGAKFVPVFGTKQKFTLARLRKGLCVGQCNGDVMFLDPTTKYSVWGYSPAGGYVGKLADSFAHFLVPPKPKMKAARKAPAKKAAGRKAAPKADAVQAPVPAPTATPAPPARKVSKPRGPRKPLASKPAIPPAPDKAAA